MSATQVYNGVNNRTKNLLYREDTTSHDYHEDTLEALFKWGDQIAEKANLTSEKLRHYIQEVRQQLRA